MVVYLPHSQFAAALGKGLDLDRPKTLQVVDRLSRVWLDLLKEVRAREALLVLMVNELKAPSLITLFYCLFLEKLMAREEDSKILHKAVEKRLRL